MKVTLELPADGIGASIKAFDDDGEEVQVSRLEIEPMFYAARSTVPIAYGHVHAQRGEEAEEVQRFVLAVSGVTATCKLSNRSEPKLSAFESDDEKE